MLSKVLKTPVDEIVDFVKEKKEVNLIAIQEKFKFPMEIVERWLVILEEYKIFKVQYRGFDGIVTYVEEVKKNNDDLNINNLKEMFMKKSKNKNIPIEDMGKIWPMFILKYEEDIKKLFFIGAKERNFTAVLANEAWAKYREELVVLN